MNRTVIAIALTVVVTAVSTFFDVSVPRPSRLGAAAMTFAPMLLVIAILFWWLHYDSLEHRTRRSAIMNIGLVALCLVALPIYLFKSRAKGQRLSAIAIAFGVFFLLGATDSAVSYLATTVLGVPLPTPDSSVNADLPVCAFYLAIAGSGRPAA